jgi:hypothetical protein
LTWWGVGVVHPDGDAAPGHLVGLSRERFPAQPLPSPRALINIVFAAQ